VVSLNYKVKHIKKHFSTRPGIKLLRLQALVDHWTANFGATAQGHFKYFNDTLPSQNDLERAVAKKEGREERIRYASAHIFVDKDEAIELVPLDEVCFHANDRTLQLPTLRASTPEYRGGNANLLTIGIEMCVEKNGAIHPDTIERTRLVIKMLQDKFSHLKDTKNRVVRHYDVTGKPCPLPFVEDEQKWNAFLYSVDQPVKVAAKEVSSIKEEDSADGKLVRGEQGPNVKLLNNMLHTLEYTQKTDDLFDQYTEAALKAFQKDHNLKQDGIYTSSVGRVMVKAIQDSDILQKSDIPEKSSDKYRLAKILDTGNKALIESLLKDGYKILDTPE
jgi:N-acetylmuramoyl-L-alanine amidase CwlA